MNLHEIFEKRQSNRKYSDRPVKKEDLLLCLDAARLAPSALNAQAWKFIVIDEPELKKNIAELAHSLGMNKFAVQAPVIIACVIEKPRITSYLGEIIQDKDYRMLDLGIAIENICLQATELGLGTCIMGWFNETKAKALLGVPHAKRMPILITLGYSEDKPTVRHRKPLEKIVSYNKY